QAALNKCCQVRHVIAFKLAQLFEGLGGVQLRREQHTERLLQGLQPLRRKAATFEADFVNAECLVFPPRGGERKRQDVLRNNRPTTDEGIAADDAMLMNRAEGAQRDVVL